MPKADETARLGYRVKGGTDLAVEGVCRFDESSVSCWDAEGRTSEDLTSRVESGLARNTEYNSLQVRYGMKNRILVTRLTQVPIVNGEGDRRNLSLSNVGSDPRYGSGGYVQMPEEPTEWKPGVPQIRREARLFAVPKSERETTMRLILSEPMPKPVEIRLAKGARATLNGLSFRVLSIDPAELGGGWFGSSGKVWSIRIATSGKPTRPASIDPRLGKPAYADKAGRLVNEKTYSEWQRKRMEAYQTGPGPAGPSEEPYRPVQVSMRQTVRGTSTETEILMNADPKSVGRIMIGGSYMKTIEVGGIPVDPR